MSASRGSMNNEQFQPSDSDYDQVKSLTPSQDAQTSKEPVIVVIAEDDPVSRRLVTAVVENGGFRTIVASNGEEAMTALREWDRPCVAVIDWMMPGMDGAEVCRQTRESGKSVYIIMLTARGSKEDIVQGMDNGADDYMAKPFDWDELLARIRAGVRKLESELHLNAQIEELHGAVTEAKVVKFQLAAARTNAPAVLVLEDDSAMQAIFEIYLTSFGYRVLVAKDAGQALRMVSARSDIRILILNGLGRQQLASKALDVLPDLRILFCSDQSPDALTKGGLELSARNFLPRPYRPAELKRKMEELLAHS
jgi:DNA-binding response OmpR family regulator